MSTILQINNLNYGLFHDFNLTIDEEKFISIIGSNKSGKTTLFNVISGIIPTTHVVSIKENDLTRQNVNNYIKSIGLVSKCQNNSFLFTKVYDEMSYPLKNLGYCDRFIKRRINKILGLFSLDIIDKEINQLTEYEKQVLLFCIALLHKPKLLLIDDVFSFMMEDDVNKIIDVLKNIKSLSIINFSSNLNQLSKSDYVYVLGSGKIVLEGNAQTIKNENQLLMKLGLEVPFIDNLSNKLKEIGIINCDFNNLEDLVNTLWK